jgi:hypothetical protein
MFYVAANQQVDVSVVVVFHVDTLEERVVLDVVCAMQLTMDA